MLTLNVSRRSALIVALLLIIGAIWLNGDDHAEAGVPLGDGIDLVYVAVSTNFPDSLGVGPGAAANAAPILLLPTNPPIPAVTQAELERLDPKKVVIVGGPAVISDAMKDALETLLPAAAVERIGGADRYETNTQFTQSVYPIEGWAAVAAAAFTPTNEDRGFVLNTLAYDDTGGTMYASIQLPHGAEILELKAIGSVSTSFFRVHLGRSSVSTSQEFATAESSGTGDVAFSTTAIDADKRVVDNENWVYHLRASVLDSNRRLYGVMVRYRLGAPGS